MYQRLIVVWKAKRGYTMERWSDDLVRSGIVPLVSEPQLDGEDEWCASRGIVKVGLAVDHKEEIEPYLPAGLRQIKISVGYTSVSQGKEQTWRAYGFPPGSVVRVSVRFDDSLLVLGPDTVADSSGKAFGAFIVGTNIPAQVVKIRIESSSDPFLFGEEQFTVKLSSESMVTRYSSERFTIISDIPSDLSWFHRYIEKAYEQLRLRFGHEPRQYLPIECTIKRGPPGGIAGWTGNGKMGVQAAEFAENRWCLLISAHELVNLFTGSICPGWPIDWWANHKSPFPAMIATEIARELGYVHEAEEHDRELQRDPLYVWHRNVRKTYGWSLYERMFSAIKEDGIEWDRLGPNPGKLRTNYVLAYMCVGAQETRLPMISETIPNADFHMVRDIVRVRQKIRSSPLKDQRLSRYLTGDYASLLESF